MHTLPDTFTQPLENSDPYHILLCLPALSPDPITLYSHPITLHPHSITLHPHSITLHPHPITLHPTPLPCTPTPLSCTPTHYPAPGQSLICTNYSGMSALGHISVNYERCIFGWRWSSTTWQ